MTKIVLWDIDGTLLDSDGAGRRGLTAAMQSCFGIDADLSDIEIAGRTDLFIVRQIFQKYDIDDNTNIPRFRSIYHKALQETIAEGAPFLYPNIMACLEVIDKKDNIIQGLLTGNFSEAAKVKTTFLGIDRFFAFGAYGEHCENRATLAKHAVLEAQKLIGQSIAQNDVYVLGDTNHDIACGKAIGATTIAVTTGSYTKEQLTVEKPDYLVNHLSVGFLQSIL